MTWTCIKCGRTGNIGDYCLGCGSSNTELFNSDSSNAQAMVTPSPTPTPSPSDDTSSDLTSTLTPTPTPSPTSTTSETTIDETPVPTPTQRRFYSAGTDEEGNYIIIDRDNNYTIKYSEENGYVAYNEDNQEVYHIYNDDDGIISFTLSNGEHIVTKDDISIEDIYNVSMKITDINGNEYVISNRKLSSKKVPNDDGSYNMYKYREDGSYILETSSGDTIYYDKDGKEYKHVYSDGQISYKTEKGDNLVTYDNGTYYIYSENGERGTYEIDENGNVICTDYDGNVTIRNGEGKVIEYIGSDGTTKTYDYTNYSEITTNNGKTTYSMINHIEYDEEEYDKVLETFNEIGEYPTGIQSDITTIDDTVNMFPDKYSSSISSLGNTLVEHIEFVDTIKEMTNYSLLAYQTCDDNLKDNLYTLIDSIFGDNESTLATNFKNNISNSVEDRDNDSILEYKSDTDFKLLYENILPTKEYTDRDGNKWYFNANNKLVGTDGENFKLNYGGEFFTMSYDEKGNIIIKDSDGKSLDIFGEYNLTSNQYGGNQGDFSGTKGLELMNDETVQSILDKYFPDATSEERYDLLNKICETGCGYVAMTNLVFKSFEGNESGFYDTFGYPMYNVSLVDGRLSIDYNYEPLITDIYCYANEKNTIDETTKYGNGTAVSTRNSIESYLKREYGFTFDSIKGYAYIGELGYSLYNMNGDVFVENGGPHAMIVTGYTEDGQQIVSSWGTKYICNSSSNVFNQLYSNLYKKDYN